MVAPLAAYLPARLSGSLVFTAGQLPMVNGALPTTGKVGDAVSAEDAYGLARQAALNGLAAIDALVGLDAVVGVIKVVGFVACVPSFTQHPAVINGASELLGQVFGHAGAHARSAVGVTSLPLDSPVEVELVVELRSDSQPHWQMMFPVES